MTATKPKAAPTSAPPALGVPGKLPRSRIRPSPTNPRTWFDPAYLQELADSYDVAGVLVPLLVRPMPHAGVLRNGTWVGVDYFELVDGECRFRAAELKGLEELPVHVRWLTDEQALMIQIISNDERRDARPSERAKAYRRLADLGWSAERIAEERRLPVSAVRGILALGKLPAWAWPAVDAGTLPRSTAELAVRVPGDRLREKFLYCVMAGLRSPPAADSWPDLIRFNEKADHDGGLAYREAKTLLHSHFTRELKGAPFSRKSPALLPEAGSCDDCPKRAGNDAEAKAEGIRADTCLDPDCYGRKVGAALAEMGALKKSLATREKRAETKELAAAHPDRRATHEVEKRAPAHAARARLGRPREAGSTRVDASAGRARDETGRPEGQIQGPIMSDDKADAGRVLLVLTDAPGRCRGGCGTSFANRLKRALKALGRNYGLQAKWASADDARAFLETHGKMPCSSDVGGVRPC